MTSARANPTILLLVLLFLWLSGAASAASEDCRDGMLRLHVANIANGLTGRFGALPEGDIDYARDPREGCLIWLRIEKTFWVARINEGTFSSWRACEIQFRWEDPALASLQTRPSLPQVLIQGDAPFAQVLLDYVGLSRCRIFAVMMADGSMGLVLPPRTRSGESHWTRPSAALTIPQTIDLPRGGEHLAPLLRLAFAENDNAPLVIGPRGGVFDISGRLIARFIDRGVAGSVRREVCQPDMSALGAPDLTDAEIAQLTGGNLANHDAFLAYLVGPPTAPIDIRAVALNC